jgi:hypothetical protein
MQIILKIYKHTLHITLKALKKQQYQVQLFYTSWNSRHVCYGNNIIFSYIQAASLSKADVSVHVFPSDQMKLINFYVLLI